MNDITALTQRMLLDFTKPLETESGEPVKHVCHDVIEYRCARVCVDAATGIVYSSPYVGLKIRNASQYAVLRKFTEEAASAYSDFENGYISDMKCGDRSHEYLMFVKEPANVLALVEALEAKLPHHNGMMQLSNELVMAKQRIAELESRTVTEPQSDYFASLVVMARVSADKAMRKFPQPNYVLLKVAEEAGEVVQAGVHYAEKRMEWEQVEGEIVQLLAMLIRLVTEGDQINGITPPAAGIQVIEGEGQ